MLLLLLLWLGNWHGFHHRVLTEDREWRHFKALCELSTPMEDGMFCRTDEVPQILLRAKETIYIPFKYQSFKADDSVVPLVRIMTTCLLFR